MATKNCPKCDSANPVACKKCACGHVFFTTRRSANSIAVDYAEDLQEPSPPPEPEIPCRRTTRVTRERPKYYDALQVEHQTRRLRDLNKKRKASKSDEIDVSSEDVPEKPVATTSKKRAESPPVTKVVEPPVKKRRGRPPGLTNRRSGRAQILATNKTNDSVPKPAEFFEEEEQDAAGNMHSLLTPTKALQLNMVLSDINSRIASTSVRAEEDIPMEVCKVESSKPLEIKTEKEKKPNASKNENSEKNCKATGGSKHQESKIVSSKKDDCEKIEVDPMEESSDSPSTMLDQIETKTAIKVESEKGVVSEGEKEKSKDQEVLSVAPSSDDNISKETGISDEIQTESQNILPVSKKQGIEDDNVVSDRKEEDAKDNTVSERKNDSAIDGNKVSDCTDEDTNNGNAVSDGKKVDTKDKEAILDSVKQDFNDIKIECKKEVPEEKASETNDANLLNAEVSDVKTTSEKLETTATENSKDDIKPKDESTSESLVVDTPKGSLTDTENVAPVLENGCKTVSESLEGKNDDTKSVPTETKLENGGNDDNLSV